MLLRISTDVNTENDGFMLAVMSCSISQLLKSFHFQPACFVSLSATTKQSAALKMKLNSQLSRHISDSTFAELEFCKNAY